MCDSELIYRIARLNRTWNDLYSNTDWDKLSEKEYHKISNKLLVIEDKIQAIVRKVTKEQFDRSGIGSDLCSDWEEYQ
jgi:hypothetical protein